MILLSLLNCMAEKLLKYLICYPIYLYIPKLYSPMHANQIFNKFIK